jgi:hypothetical protein
MDPKKPKPNVVSGTPPALRCNKCGGAMVPVPNSGNMKACSKCGNRSSSVRI